MYEDIIWQREAIIKDDLQIDLENKIIQLPNGFYYIYQNYDEIKEVIAEFNSNLAFDNLNNNNNNSNLEKSISFFSLSDLCCNLHVYIKKFFFENKKLSHKESGLNNKNNNNDNIEPLCHCWTIGGYMKNNHDYTASLMSKKKLIKLNDKEKFDLLNLENFNDPSENNNKNVKTVENSLNSSSNDSLSSVISNFSLKNEINFIKKLSANSSIENKSSDELFNYCNFFQNLRSSIETGKSSLNETTIEEAVLNLGINLSQISTCPGSVYSHKDLSSNIDTIN